MARLSRIDNINNIENTHQTQDTKIREFFEEMELPIDEIEERIALAIDLDAILLSLFAIISAIVALGNEIDVEYYKQYLLSLYNDALARHNYDMNDSYYGDYTDYVVDGILTTTYERIAQSYYLSDDRATEIACNDTNAVANHKREIQAIKDGYTHKEWRTMLDRRVRKTHIHVDGHVVPIQEPFEVGGSLMLFPMDTSLGAEPKEIIGCRCVCKYIR